MKCIFGTKGETWVRWELAMHHKLYEILHNTIVAKISSKFPLWKNTAVDIKLSLEILLR